MRRGRMATTAGAAVALVSMAAASPGAAGPTVKTGLARAQLARVVPYIGLPGVGAAVGVAQAEVNGPSARASAGLADFGALSLVLGAISEKSPLALPALPGPITADSAGTQDTSRDPLLEEAAGYAPEGVPAAPGLPAGAREEAHAAPAPESRALVHGAGFAAAELIGVAGGESLAEANPEATRSVVRLDRLTLGGAGIPAVVLSGLVWTAAQSAGQPATASFAVAGANIAGQPLDVAGPDGLAGALETLNAALVPAGLHLEVPQILTDASGGGEGAGPHRHRGRPHPHPRRPPRVHQLEVPALRPQGEARHLQGPGLDSQGVQRRRAGRGQRRRPQGGPGDRRLRRPVGRHPAVPRRTVRQKVVSFGGLHLPSSYYQARAPYAWGQLIDCTTLIDGAVDLMAKRFKPGTTAGRSGSASMRNQPRKYGLLVPDDPVYKQCIDDGRAKLKAAGIEFAKEIRYGMDFAKMQQEAPNIVAQLKQAGVTTLVLVTDPALPYFLTGAATQQDYWPEWVVTGTVLTDVDIVGQFYDQDQWQFAAGQSFLSDIFQGNDSESYRAYKAVRPDEPAITRDQYYYSFLMLFIGLQMAGPNLTPETFQAGMFSYPARTGSLGRWSFSPTDYTAIDDAREIYYDRNALSAFNNRAGRYVTLHGGGASGGRRGRSTWPCPCRRRWRRDQSAVGGAADRRLRLALAVPLAWGVLAAVLGALCDRVIISRFFWAPRLVLTVATIGLAQVLGGLELGIPGWFGVSGPLGGLQGAFETPLKFDFRVAPLRFTGAHVMAMAVVPATVVLLALFLRKTSVGIGIRAAAANPERAMLLGVPVRRLSTVVWAIAAVLSAVSAMLAAPLVGQGSSLASGPALLLPALAAAVIARMESLPAALFGGMAVGVLQQGVLWNTSRSSYTDVALFAVVIGGLLLQRHRLSRADDALGGSWSAAGEAPPVPPVLARLPEVVWGRRALVAAAVLAAVLAPNFMRPSQISLLGSVTIVYAIVALSLVVLTGWAGQISLGQFAIAGLGAAVCGDLVSKTGADLIFALIAGSAAGCVAALLIGLPALRVRGLFLAVATLAFAVPMSSFALNPANFPGLIPQQVERSVVLSRFDLHDERTLYFFCLIVLLLALVLVIGIRRARPGRAMVAVRDNERAAQARGVRASGAKLAAFAVSGALAGLAGGLHAIVLDGVRAGSFSPAMSFEAFVMVVLGGATSLGGALAGAIFLRWAQYVMTGSAQLIVTGAGVLVVLLVMPGGLGQLTSGIRQRIYAFIAFRRRIDLAAAAQPPSGAPDPGPVPVVVVTGGPA